jgi:PAS domain S-box-containing protein
MSTTTNPVFFRSFPRSILKTSPSRNCRPCYEPAPGERSAAGQGHLRRFTYRTGYLKYDRVAYNHKRVGIPLMYKVLYVDDEPDLLELTKIFLEQTGDFLIETETEAPHALPSIRDAGYDAIISDYMMPDMDGITFLKAIRKQYGDIPFILFTGKGREEVVIAAINNGADFYLQKGGAPTAQFAELAHQLRQAITRRKAQDELRAAYEQITASEEELRSQLDELIFTQKEKERTETQFRSLVDNAPDAIFIETGGIFRYLNMAAVELFGASSADQLTGTLAFDRVHPSLHAGIRQRQADVTEGLTPAKLQEEIYLRLDGTPMDVEVAAVPYEYRGSRGALVMVHDITERKRAETELRAAYEQITASEEELREQYDELEKAQHELREQNEQIDEIAGTIPGVIFQYFSRSDGKMGFSYISDRAEEIFGISRHSEDIIGSFARQVDPRDRDAFLASIGESIRTGEPWDFEGRYIRPSGESIWFQGYSRPFRRESETIFSGILIDVTSRKKGK